MTHRPLLILVFGLLIIPQTVLGAVRMNEISWMGNVDSSANEWIEIWNDGDEPVSLSGWTLGALDGSPLITLDGTIVAGGYYLIERTDDDSVLGVSADLIASFGSGISNSGESLQLKNGNGVIVDEVLGGEDWVNIGGDNITKATAQRTSSGWVTAAPTPRAINASAPQQTPQTIAGATQSTTATTSPTPTPATGSLWVSQSPYPRQNIVAFAPEDLRASVGAPVTFIGESKGLFDETLPYATYHWNFGDGTTGVGKSLDHTYSNPGSYLVVLEVVWGNHRATDRLKVLVTRTDVVITSVGTSSDGLILLKNVSAKDLDLSGFTLGVATTTFFVFPTNSLILPSESLPLPMSVSLVPPNINLLELRYANGNIASSFVRIIEGSRTSSPKSKVNTVSHGTVLGSVVAKNIEIEKVYSEDVKEQVASVGMLKDDIITEQLLSPWTMLFVALILLGVITTLYIRSLRPVPEAERYSIVEEDEG